MKDANAVALGRKGGKAGAGAAKARSSEQARAAALVRWANVNAAKKKKLSKISLNMRKRLRIVRI